MQSNAPYAIRQTPNRPWYVSGKFGHLAVLCTHSVPLVVIYYETRFLFQSSFLVLSFYFHLLDSTCFWGGLKSEVFGKHLCHRHNLCGLRYDVGYYARSVQFSDVGVCGRASSIIHTVRTGCQWRTAKHDCMYSTIPRHYQGHYRNGKDRMNTEEEVGFS